MSGAELRADALPGNATEITRWVTERSEDIFALAEAFIALPSENRPPLGEERLFQEYLRAQLSSLGMEVTSFLVTDVPGIADHALYWPGRSYEDRPNIVGRLRGRGAGPSLMFAGHGDVVPGIPGDHDPFRPTRREGRLYGRGSSDMKGGLAAGVMAIRCLTELGIELHGDLFLESVVDEEMAGANGTLASRLLGYNPDGALIMEPTGMIICPSHRGGRAYRIVLRGAGGMGYGGMELLSPLHGMGRLLVALEGLASSPDPAMATGNPLILNAIVSHAHAGSFAPAESTGVPHEASVEVWVEVAPGISSDELDRAFVSFCHTVAKADPLLGRCELDVMPLTRFISGAAVGQNHPLVTACRESVGVVMGESAVSVREAPFACDGFVFEAFGVACVILGPTGDNAHSQDEFVEMASLLFLTATLAETAARWCGVVSE